MINQSQIPYIARKCRRLGLNTGSNKNNYLPLHKYFCLIQTNIYNPGWLINQERF